MKNNWPKIKINTEKILYYLFLSGGMVAASIISPKLPYEVLRNYSKNKKFLKHRFNRDINRLKKKGDVRIYRDSIIITQKGKERILKYQLDEIEIKEKNKWDKKWRLVIFDIPEKQRKKSNVLRRKLISMGFLSYQKSVFIIPYPCRDEIDYIKEIYEVSPYVKYITAINIDNGEIYRTKFKLNNNPNL